MKGPEGGYHPDIDFEDPYKSDQETPNSKEDELSEADSIEIELDSLRPVLEEIYSKEEVDNKKAAELEERIQELEERKYELEKEPIPETDTAETKRGGKETDVDQDDFDRQITAEYKRIDTKDLTSSAKTEKEKPVIKKEEAEKTLETADPELEPSLLMAEVLEDADIEEETTDKEIIEVAENSKQLEEQIRKAYGFIVGRVRRFVKSFSRLFKEPKRELGIQEERILKEALRLGGSSLIKIENIERKKPRIKRRDDNSVLDAVERKIRTAEEKTFDRLLDNIIG